MNGADGSNERGSLRAVIFSKNRGCQLDLLLRSMREQTADGANLSIAVLYAADDRAFEGGYARVRELHPGVSLHLQTAGSLKEQIQQLVTAERREFFTFFVDDNVFVRPLVFSAPPFEVMRSRAEVASLALRLNPRIRFCQPLKLRTPPPFLDPDLTWRWQPSRSRVMRHLAPLWRLGIPLGDWAGSMFIDGYVFRHREFAAYFSQLPELPYVTRIEAAMLATPLPGDRVVCFPESRIINLVLNRVDRNSVYPHPGGSVEDLNRRFMTGDRLSYSQYVNVSNETCHIVGSPSWISGTS